MNTEEYVYAYKEDEHGNEVPFQVKLIFYSDLSQYKHGGKYLAYEDKEKRVFLCKLKGSTANQFLIQSSKRVKSRAEIFRLLNDRYFRDEDGE